MAGRIRLGTETLLMGGDNVATALGNVESTLSTLESLVSQFVGIWEGLGHDDFAGFYSTWQQIAEEFHAALGRLQALLLTAHGNYSAAEQANLTMWGGR